MIDVEGKESAEEKRRRSISHNNYEKFDISSFLIAETNDIKLDQNIRQTNLNQQILPFSAKMKKESLKNMKIDKKLKVKNREKVQSLHS